MLRGRRAWSTPAPILAEAAALDFGVVTYMIVRRLHPPPPGPRAPPQVTRRMAAAVLGLSPKAATGTVDRGCLPRGFPRQASPVGGICVSARGGSLQQRAKR